MSNFKDSYILINIGYRTICVPFKEGMKIVRLLENAEGVEGYGTDKKFVPFGEGDYDVNFEILSKEKYQKIKVNQTLTE